MLIKPLVEQFFSILEDSTFCSILPTSTQYSRNAIFSGLMPSQIKKYYPHYWVDDFEKGGKIATNLFQLYEFCRLQIIEAFGHNTNDGLKKSYDALSQIVLAWDTMEK